MPMSKLTRTVVLVAMLAVMNLAGLVAVAQAHTGYDPASARHRALGWVEFRATADHRVASQEQPSADATVRRLSARERSSIPNEAPAQAQATDTRAALAQERYYNTWGYGDTPAPPAAPAEPSGQPTWLVITLAVLAAVLALVAGIALAAARHATQHDHANQTA